MFNIYKYENYSCPISLTGKNLEIMRWIVEYLLSKEQNSITKGIYNHFYLAVFHNYNENQFRSPYLIYNWFVEIVLIYLLI